MQVDELANWTPTLLLQPCQLLSLSLPRRRESRALDLRLCGDDGSGGKPFMVQLDAAVGGELICSVYGDPVEPWFLLSFQPFDKLRVNELAAVARAWFEFGKDNHFRLFAN